MTVGFAVVGADHLHLFPIVEGLLQAGAVPVAHTADGDLIGIYAGWQPDSEARPLDAVLADDAVDLVVTVGVHDTRADVAVAAIEAGRAVLSAKPGVVSRPDLDRIRAAVAGRPGRPWTVLFSERFENRAIAAAVAHARAGSVGTVVAVHGSAPHALNAEARPDWFWDRARTGGLLVDLASHQVDQFLAVCGTSDDPTCGVEVRSARLGNVANPTRLDFDDIGSLTLAGPHAIGEHRVDWLSSPGLPTWGDVRLTIHGTLGTLEVRANIDVAGESGAEHLILTDADGVRRIDVTEDLLDWAELLLADVADGGERLMTQAHALAVTDLTLQATERAEPWGRA